jgi:hypothetical protein
MPNNITSIKDEAFYNCQKLESLIIPKSVKEIGKDVFSYCSSLTIKTTAGSKVIKYFENISFRKKGQMKLEII